MNRFTIVRKIGLIALAAMLVVLAASSSQAVSGAAASGGNAVTIAQAGGTEPRELEPRYQPVPPEEKGMYNSSYIFGMTRGLAASTIHPAAKAPLFLFTVPLDLVFFPFASIGGFFG